MRRHLIEDVVLFASRQRFYYQFLGERFRRIKIHFPCTRVQELISYTKMRLMYSRSGSELCLSGPDARDACDFSMNFPNVLVPRVGKSTESRSTRNAHSRITSRRGFRIDFMYNTLRCERVFFTQLFRMDMFVMRIESGKMRKSTFQIPRVFSQKYASV